MEYEFTLKYQLMEKDNDRDELLERFGAEGCCDALIGIGLAGRVGLAFTREAETAKDALLSAMSDIRRVIPTAKLIEAGPDFVGLTDVADLVQMSRQNLRKLMTTHASNFPLPVHEGSTVVWHLADLLNWLESKGEYEIKPGVVEVSNTTKQINVAKQAMQISIEDQQEMAELIC